MTIYILQIPHQRQPIAWVAESVDDALGLVAEEAAKLGYDDYWYETATEDQKAAALTEIVNHDMHAATWSKRYSDVIDWLKLIMHQRFAAERALYDLCDQHFPANLYAVFEGGDFIGAFDACSAYVAKWKASIHTGEGTTATSRYKAVAITREEEDSIYDWWGGDDAMPAWLAARLS